MLKVDIFSPKDCCPDTCRNISSNRLALLDSVRSVVVGLPVKLDGRVCLESGTLDAGQQKFTRPLGASHVYPITKQTTYFLHVHPTENVVSKRSTLVPRFRSIRVPSTKSRSLCTASTTIKPHLTHLYQRLTPLGPFKFTLLSLHTVGIRGIC